MQKELFFTLSLIDESQFVISTNLGSSINIQNVYSVFYAVYVLFVLQKIISA